jgi:hypothetical protein
VVTIPHKKPWFKRMGMVQIRWPTLRTAGYITIPQFPEDGMHNTMHSKNQQQNPDREGQASKWSDFDLPPSACFGCCGLGWHILMYSRSLQRLNLLDLHKQS